MRDFIWIAIAIVACIAIPCYLEAQSQLECNGRLFRVLERDGGTALQELNLEENELRAEIQELAFFKEVRINAICYSSSHNYIYGVLLEEPYVLCRIDGDYNLTRLQELPLPINLTFVAGDISPDGRYLVLLGFSLNEPGNLLAKVDLTQPGYPTELIPLATNGNSHSIACVDIAFHPTTNILYGFNHRDHRLITIDIERQLIDNTTYPASQRVMGNVPSIFFDAYGNLYGVGSVNEVVTNRSLMLFDTETGAVRVGEGFGLEGNQDGCSCPYTVDLLNSFKSKKVFPCTENEIELVIINRSPFEQIDAELLDTFPHWLEILSIEDPFEGVVQSGLGTNVLQISDLLIPIGVDTIKLRVRTNEHAPSGVFSNQAFLKNIYLRQDSDLVTVPSDDPETPIFDDPTTFSVSNLKVDFSDQEITLCQGDSLVLDAGVYGIESYMWSTGETSSKITIKEAGIYKLRLASACENAAGSIEVKMDDIFLDLGGDMAIEMGEEIEFEPDIRTGSPINYYYWSGGGKEEYLSCSTCPSPLMVPHTSTSIQLEVANEFGCKAVDQLNITVHPFAMYAPTAFSPNDDGKNDQFFLQGRTNYAIRTFQVYDRWGNLIFQEENAFANNALFGWDGKFKNKLMNAGLYIWQAEIDLAAGKIEKRNGELMLIR